MLGRDSSAFALPTPMDTIPVTQHNTPTIVAQVFHRLYRFIIMTSPDSN
jgi:hypothetical protein